MNRPRYLPSRSHLALVAALVALAFALRLYGLGRSPLRGDEAFAVRYWAEPPAEILDPVDGLAWREPHPFGAFFGFWAWKSLVGDGEVAMRLLPALLNLLGVPALYGIGRRLSGTARVGLFGALLWALNPHLVWHSQDVRNYAIWAGLSAVAFWLLLCAAGSRNAAQARIRWAGYVVVAALALYTFFLEAFMIAAHGASIFIFRRERLRAWAGSLLAFGVLLIPWFGQVIALATSGYRGTATSQIGGDALWRFYQALLFGEISASGGIAAFLLFGAWAASLAVFCRGRARIMIAAGSGLPLALLVVASTGLAVFHPRYILAVTPLLLLPWAYLLASVRRIDRAAAIWLVVFSAAWIAPTWEALRYYSGGEYRKAPDWYGLRDYLREMATADDTVIAASVDPASGATDPAFAYYYSGPARVVPLPHPALDIDQTVRRELETRRAVWFVVTGEATEAVNAALLRYGMLISDESAYNSFPVRQYRAKSVRPSEIEHPVRLSLGGGTLRGYSLTGPMRSGSALTVLLFWEKLPAANLTTFVHLVGPLRPDGSPIWTQHDHPPSGERDIYRLDFAGVPPGEYRIEIGLYDLATAARALISDPVGMPLGESYALTPLTVRASD